jgi:hypothetical protein
MIEQVSEHIREPKDKIRKTLGVAIQSALNFKDEYNRMVIDKAIEDGNKILPNDVAELNKELLLAIKEKLEL